MHYTHWFWDFDGTLYDTYPRIVRAFQKGLRAKGIGVPDEKVLSLVKIGLGTAARHFEEGRLEQELMALYIQHAEDEGPQGLTPFPGAGDALREVVRRGGKNYLYTHRDRTSVEGLTQHGLWPLFTDAVTAEDDFPHKPQPDALLHLLDKHGLDPRDCVMVGDRPIDLDAGRNAGMDSILFDTDGFYPDTPATHRFTSYAQFLEALRQDSEK